ncbi:hypothetical protein D3C85_1156550 [compost metagenome]
MAADRHAAEHVRGGGGLIGNQLGVGLTVDLRLHGEHIDQHGFGHLQFEVQQSDQLPDQLISRQIDGLRLGQVQHHIGAALTVGGVERQVFQGHLWSGRQQFFQAGLEQRLFGFGQFQLRCRQTGRRCFGHRPFIRLQFALVNLHQRQGRRNVEVLQAHGQRTGTNGLAVQGHFANLVIGTP